VSSTAAPSVRAQEEKAKKQKRLLAVLSVFLLALLGYQMPKLLGGSGASSTSPPPQTVAAETLPGAGSGLPAGQLPNTDHVALQPGSTKLISFGLFKSKDPFVQQLSTLPGAATPAPAPAVAPPLRSALPLTPVATPSPSQPQVTPAPTGSLTPMTPTPNPASKGPATPTTPAPIPATPVTPITPTPVSTTSAQSVTTPKPATAAPAAQGAVPTSVAISTNDTCENIGVNGTFPGKEDIFRVVSIGRDGKTAKIGVVGGAYDSGDATAMIELGERITLVNTADGTRYVIMMQAHCTAGTPPAAPAAPAQASAVPTTTLPTTTLPTSTVAPPTPTSTVTTPIVTDSLDTTTPQP
jgi:hypothetical protein